jgi:hypothetical protein
MDAGAAVGLRYVLDCNKEVTMATNPAWAIYAASCFLASASAQASQSLLEVVRSCESQADDAARLRCYDRGVARFKGAVDSATSDPRCTNRDSPVGSAAGPKPTSVTQSPATASPTNTAETAEGFGLTSGQILAKQSGEERTRPLKRVTAHIVTLSQRSGGKLVLHLDNNQVWEQSEEGPDLRMRTGDSITIDRGMLGAYWLSVPSGPHGAIKVRRLQ